MAQSRIERMLNEVRITSYGKLAVVTIAAAFIAAFVAMTSMTSGELTAGEPAVAPAASEDFVYFPNQYVNKGTEPTEHIQAY